MNSDIFAEVMNGGGVIEYQGETPPGGEKESYPPICIDKEHFLISRTDFESLPEYSFSKPTGVHDGKCWKRNVRGRWWIVCYLEETPPHPDGMLTPSRKALIID